MEIVRMQKVSYAYGEKEVIKDLNFKIKKGSWTTLVGSNGCGKSTLVRLLVGLLKGTGEIQIDGLPLTKENIKKIRSKIGILFDNPTNQLFGETVQDHIAFGLANQNLPLEDIMAMISEISNLLSIEYLLNQDPSKLSGGEKQLVALASILVLKPEILILDEAFTMVSEGERKKIFALLNYLQKKLNLTILNVTHDMEETMYGDTIAIMDEGKILIHDQKEKVYQEESLLKKVHLDLPFNVLLSLKLSYYHLLDHLVYDMDEMVDLLWK